MRTLLFFVAASIAAAQSVTQPTLPPITQKERLKWTVISTVGPANLAGGAITSAWSTWTNSPPEYGPHWDGWAMRQGLRVAGGSTSNLMEAEVGAIWGEDPRYHRAQTREFKGRVKHVIFSAFTAYNREGKAMPAYARFIAVPGSNLIGNTWRPDSQRTAVETTNRIVFSFTGRMASNAFAEFWPDVQKYVFKKK